MDEIPVAENGQKMSKHIMPTPYVTVGEKHQIYCPCLLLEIYLLRQVLLYPAGAQWYVPMSSRLCLNQKAIIL